MDFARIVDACLIFEKSKHFLNFKKTFFNQEITDKKMKVEQKVILKKMKKIKGEERIINWLALHFYFKLHVIKHASVFITPDYGAELFIIQNDNGTCFHSNPAKILRLPTGLNCCKDPKYRYSDFLEYTAVERFLRQFEFTKAFEQSFTFQENKMHEYKSATGIGLEIWTKSKIDGKLEPVRSTQLSEKNIFYLDNQFNILFLVTHEKLFFRRKSIKK